MKSYDYSNITSVEQLCEQYNLKSLNEMIIEKKKEIGRASCRERV